MPTLVIPPWSDLTRRSVLSSSSADSAFPVANLGDQIGGNPFRFGADGNGSVEWDTEPSDQGGYRDSGYEAATMAEGGHVDTSSAGNDASLAAVGGCIDTQALKLNVAAVPGYAEETRTFTRIPTGSRGTISARLLGDATVPAAVRVRIKQLDVYLDSTGAWGAPGVAQDVWSCLPAAWEADGPLAFDVPSYEETGLPYVSIEVIVRSYHASSTGIAWADEVRLTLAPNCLAFHGNNVMPAVSLAWQASATGAWAGEEVTLATPVVSERKFFSRLAAPSDLRFHRLTVTGTNGDDEPGGPQVWFGEVALAHAFELSCACEWPCDVEPTLNEWEDHEREKVKLSWIWRSDAERREALREIATLSRFGEHPFWIVPVAAEPRVLFCRGASGTPTRRVSIGKWRAEITFVEEPFPAWVRDDA